MHRPSDPQQPAGGPFGEAAVRDVDGEKAERTLSNESGQRNYPKGPQGREKAQRSRLLRGRIWIGRNYPNSSEFQATGPQAQPVKTVVTRY
jgi:hypothetical protein